MTTVSKDRVLPSVTHRNRRKVGNFVRYYPQWLKSRVISVDWYICRKIVRVLRMCSHKKPDEKQLERAELNDDKNSDGLQELQLYWILEICEAIVVYTGSVNIISLSIIKFLIFFSEISFKHVRTKYPFSAGFATLQTRKRQNYE